MVVSGRVDPSNPAYVECCWGVSFLLYQAVKFTNQPRRALAVFWPWTGCWECPAVFPTCPSPCPCPLLLFVRTFNLLPAQLWDWFPTLSALPFPRVYQIIFMVFSLPEDSSFFPLPPFSLVSPLLTLLSSLLLSFPVTDLLPCVVNLRLWPLPVSSPPAGNTNTFRRVALFVGPVWLMLSTE